MKKTDIKEIVQRAVQGEQSAFAELYAISYNRVYFYAYRMLQNEQDAADIVQEVFITVFTSLGSLKNPESYMCWLSKITVNLCRDFCRKTTRLAIDRETDDLIERIADEACATENIILQNDSREYLIRIIDILPDEQKRAVLLYYYEQLTVSQIAEIEEVSVSTIKNRLSYARKKIKKAISFEETRSGTKLFAFGMPALAVVLSQYAAASAMPVYMAREIFMAAMAVANLGCGAKAFDIVGLENEYAAGSKAGLLHNNLLLQIRPAYILCAAAVLVILIAGIFVSARAGAQEPAAETALTYAEVPVDIATRKLGGDVVRISPSDIPKQVLQEAASYSYIASSGEKRTLTPETALLRTIYQDRHTLKTDQLAINFYRNTTLVIAFYDGTDTMLGYTYVNYGVSVNWPDKLKFIYDFDLDQDNILSEARADTEAMMSEAVRIDESDMQIIIGTDGKRQLELRHPDMTAGTEYICCIWTDEPDNHEELMTDELVSNRLDDGRLKGSTVFDSNIPSYICDVQDMRYCLVAFIGDGRVTHIGYIDTRGL